MDEGGSRDGGSVRGSSVRGPWWGDFINGDPGRYVEKAPETGISFHQGCAWEPGRGLICRGHRKMKEGGALEMGYLSPRKLYEGNLEGGLLYW